MIDIILEPSLAFGSGHHSSTYMCIKAIESCNINKTTTMLDVGCGSGILSICANKLGAKVSLCDIDELAIEQSIKHFSTIKSIRESTSLQIQLGGGIRDENTIKRYMDIGINRIILGSIAISNINFALKMSNKYRIAISIDANNGFIATNGWNNQSNIDAINFSKQFKDSNIEAIICTDISKDGTLNGINVSFSESIYDTSHIPTIASGGFKKQDILKLKENNKINGVIIGKAFYENKVNLEEILKTT